MGQGPQVAPPAGPLERQWSHLAEQASRLNDGKFLQIYALLEQLGGKPGVSAAFDTLRPRLAALRPPRRLNASRLFFQPAEDLFDDAAEYGRGLYRVSRSTLPVCWAQLAERMGGERLGEFERAVASCDPRNEMQIYQTGLPLWDQLGRHLQALTHEVENNLRFRAQTFGRHEDVVVQLQTLCGVIALAPEIEELKHRLPTRPIGDLSESQAAAARSVLARLGVEDPAAVVPVLLVLAARMRRPGDALKLLDGLRLGSGPAARDALIRDLSGTLIAQLLHRADRVGKGDRRDVVHLAAEIERLTEGFTSLNNSVALQDGKVASAAAAARAGIARLVVGQMLPDLDQRMVRALFDGANAISPARLKESEAMAQALRRVSRLGATLGVQREVARKIADLREGMAPHLDTLLRDGRQGRAMDDGAQRQVYNVIRIVEMVSGPDEAEELYRDCKRRGLPTPNA